jgi:hypothetical protein
MVVFSILLSKSKGQIFEISDSNMASFIGYINNAMLKFTIYFAGQIMHIILECFHVSIQVCAAYKHKNDHFIYIFFRVAVLLAFSKFYDILILAT